MRSPFPEKLPRWLMPTVSLLFVVSWVPLGLIAMYRSEPSPVTRVSLIPDMDKQEKFKAQAENSMFADNRAMRLPVAGTVPYGNAQTDEWHNRGIVNGSWATEFPMRPTAELIKRGQQRYEIYCSPCHGQSGYGNGMIAVRAEELLEGTWIPPSSLHDTLVRERPVGHIFNTITNGIRNMPPYGPQIPVHDRWAIVLYVRALQRSQGGTTPSVASAESAAQVEGAAE
jgi:mono/diheme cytochrome c family protein